MVHNIKQIHHIIEEFIRNLYVNEILWETSNFQIKQFKQYNYVLKIIKTKVSFFFK